MKLKCGESMPWSAPFHFLSSATPSSSAPSAMANKSEGFCPVPHTFRDQVWLVCGILIGSLTTYAILKSSSSSATTSSKQE